MFGLMMLRLLITHAPVPCIVPPSLWPATHSQYGEHTPLNTVPSGTKSFDLCTPPISLMEEEWREIKQSLSRPSTVPGHWSSP